ncbi:MAG TPA: glycosyltransferase family 39 protein [Candidatus Omnitrophota bacterium]|nr:glycosyltransferase family 39 protein [Candidatus Omnitrophota bacterium]
MRDGRKGRLHHRCRPRDLHILKQERLARFDGVYLFLLSSVFLLWGLGNGSLASWDEGLYASVAKGILKSGDWLNLSLDGKPWADKPPLAIWATAFFYKLFGVSEFTARLFSALCGIGTVIVTFLIGKKLFNRWTGFMGALVLLSSSHFLRFARFGMLDAPLTFFLSLALYFFWLGHERNRYLIFSGIAIGLAVMTKGFAAFFVFPIIFLYCLWADEWQVLTRSSYWVGIMIAVGIALPWHLYASFTSQDAFVQDVVIKHLFLRTTTALEGHIGNWYFYIRVLVNKYHPWILLGVVSAPYFLYKAIKERYEEFIFISVWMFFIFAAVTLIQTKLPWYIYPAYPALSISVGFFLKKMFGEKYRAFIWISFIAIMILHGHYSHLFEQDYSRPIKGIAPIVREKAADHDTIYLYNYHEAPAASFYLDKSSRYLDSEQAILSAAKDDPRFVCLIRENDLAPVAKRLQKAGVIVAGSYQEMRLLMLKKA